MLYPAELRAPVLGPLIRFGAAGPVAESRSALSGREYNGRAAMHASPRHKRFPARQAISTHCAATCTGQVVAVRDPFTRHRPRAPERCTRNVAVTIVREESGRPGSKHRVPNCMTRTAFLNGPVRIFDLLRRYSHRGGWQAEFHRVLQRVIFISGQLPLVLSKLCVHTHRPPRDCSARSQSDAICRVTTSRFAKSD
jgi:hypothetical protein